MKKQSQFQSNDFFIRICNSLGIEQPIKEYKFCPSRKWRADYAWPSLKIAIELEGGIWIYGRHNRGIGYKKDLEKYNYLAEKKWVLLRYLPKDIDWAQIERVYSLTRQFYEKINLENFK